MSAKLEVKDHGFYDLFKLAKEVKGGYAKVGVLADDEKGGEKHEEGDTLTVAEIAAINEYGGGNVPARPFLRAAFDEHREELAEMGKRAMQEVFSGRMKLSAALGIMGAKLAAETKKKITTNVPPPNAQSTMIRKIMKGKGVKSAENRLYNAIGKARSDMTLGGGKHGPMSADQVGAETWKRVARLASAEKNFADTLAGSAGSVKTLIDTGRMLNAVTWAIKKKGEE